MLPQLAIGGWMPRPRNDSTLSNRMMLPIDSVVETMIGEATLGSRWTHMIRALPAPSARAAVTNSRVLSDSVAPRTSRATVVQPTSETSRIIR